MVKRKTAPNKRVKPAKKSAAEAKRRGESRDNSKKNDGRGDMPAGEAQGEGVILDGTRRDSAVRDEGMAGRPWIEILVDSHTRAVVGMKVTTREVADEL